MDAIDTQLEPAYLFELSFGVSRELVAGNPKTIIEYRLSKVEGKKELEEAIGLYSEVKDLPDALKEVQLRKYNAERLRL